MVVRYLVENVGNRECEEIEKQAVSQQVEAPPVVVRQQEPLMQADEHRPFLRVQYISDREEEEVLGLIRPEEDEVQDEVQDDDMETLNIYDFEGTGEQLRRLRAYNLKNDGETDEEYEKRNWDMAYEEDEEKEMRKNEGKKIEKREKREKRETKKRKRE